MGTGMESVARSSTSAMTGGTARRGMRCVIISERDSYVWNNVADRGGVGPVAAYLLA